MVAPSFAFKGGISRVTFNYNLAGLFNDRVDYFPSIIEGSKLVKLFFTAKQLFMFPIKLMITKYSLVHIHTSSYNSFFRKSLFILIAKVAGRKVLLHIHPTHFYYFISNLKSLRKYCLFKILKLCDSFVVLTEDMQLRMKELFPTKTINVLPNPVSVNDFKLSESIGRNKNILLYMGTFLPEKGIYDIVKAAPLIIRELPGIRIVLCGDKGRASLRKEIKSLQLDSQIEIKKWVDGLEKKQLLFSSTAVILPSYSEGIPNIILEAMSSFLPIITTPVGGIPSILEDEKNCLFFEPGNIPALTNRVIRIFKDPALRRKMAQNNYSKVRSFDTSLIIKKLKNIYLSRGAYQ